MLDKRHGHGMLRCVNGTIYDVSWHHCMSCACHMHVSDIVLQGQWKNGIFHGEGKMSHSSGVVYNGLWNNGRPQCIETVYSWLVTITYVDKKSYLTLLFVS